MNPEHAELYQRIRGFPLDRPEHSLSFTDRLAVENGWSRAYAERVVEEYRKFAFLAIAAGHSVTPSDAVDQAWHLHLTYTRSYWDHFCKNVLQTPLHHGPTIGGRQERQKFAEWYRRTRESYRRFFKVQAPADIWPDEAIRFGDLGGIGFPLRLC